MYEKVNPEHPDKIADRIAGAIVDIAYSLSDAPKIAVEVLLGHGECNIIVESSEYISKAAVRDIVERIAGEQLRLRYLLVPQDGHLAKNQENGIHCGDNGIFKGTPKTEEEKTLSDIARCLYKAFKTDGKYIIDGSRLIICQSNATTPEITKCLDDYFDANPQTKKSTYIINPLGDWTGGPGVDAGATNRKLGSDMGEAVTGGGLHGKDLSKADVSVNIYAHIVAQETKHPVSMCCAIGDDTVNGVPYSYIVEKARQYIHENYGSFEKFAEWGLI